MLDPEATGYAVTSTRRIRQLQATIGGESRLGSSNDCLAVSGLCKCLAKLSPERKSAMVSVLKEYSPQGYFKSRCLRCCSILAQPKTSVRAFHVSSLLVDAGFASILANGYRELWTSDMLGRTALSSFRQCLQRYTPFLLGLCLGPNECKEFAKELAAETFALATPSTRVLSPLLRHVGNQMLELVC